jgi:hypothetical protein
MVEFRADASFFTHFIELVASVILWKSNTFPISQLKENTFSFIIGQPYEAVDLGKFTISFLIVLLFLEE